MGLLHSSTPRVVSYARVTSGRKIGPLGGGLLATLGDPCLFLVGIYKFCLYRVVFIRTRGWNETTKDFLACRSRIYNALPLIHRRLVQPLGFCFSCHRDIKQTTTSRCRYMRFSCSFFDATCHSRPPPIVIKLSGCDTDVLLLPIAGRGSTIPDFPCQQLTALPIDRKFL